MSHPMDPARGLGRAAIRLASGLLILAACQSEVAHRPPAVAPPAADSATDLRFFALGRQGYGNEASRRIAAAMDSIAANTPTHAVLYTGDNFYPVGVESVTDRQWETKFENLYAGPSLRGVPFYPVLGNHDRAGNVEALLQYTAAGRGSGRWQMPGRYYARDFGRVGGRVLLRIVFFDSIELRRAPADQLAFADSAFTAPGDPIWRAAVGHFPLRSLTLAEASRSRVMINFLPRMVGWDVDAFFSSQDHFLSIMDRPGEPLHVSTNGGGENQDAESLPGDAATDFVALGPGFVTVDVDSTQLVVTAHDGNGRPSHSRRRTR